MAEPDGRDRPKLLVLNEYYWPGPEASAHLLTELCESLGAEYDIHVITGAVQGDKAGSRRVVRNGVTIERVPSTSFDRAHLPGRAANYMTFMGSALVRGLRAGDTDVVLCMTDPPMLGAAAVFLARRRRVPLVVVCEDVFPEIASTLGRLTNPLVIGALRRTVSFYLRRADRIVAIGETMRTRLEVKGAPPDRIRVIPNWVDASLLEPRPKENAWALENGLAGKFVVMHSGNVGHAQDLDSLVRAADRLRDLDDLEVLIVGSGASARRGRAPGGAPRSRQRALSSVPASRAALRIAFERRRARGRARAGSRRLCRAESSVAGILAVGRPVIAAVDAESETAHVVETANCGFRVPPASPDLLAAAIRKCHASRVELEELGRNGREYVEREGNRTVAMERYRALLADVLRGNAPKGRAIKILRVIARLNVGGPTLHVAYLTKGLAPLGYDTTLATGRIGPNEGSMDYVASEVGVQPLYVGSLQRNLPSSPTSWRCSAWWD